MTTTDFENIIATDRLTLVAFLLPWCGPCRTIEPQLERVAQTMSHICTVIKINVSLAEHRTIVSRHKILALPSLLLFRRSEPLSRIVGIVSYERLLAILRNAQVVGDY